MQWLSSCQSSNADYVARVAPGDRSLNLSGWVTLSNASKTGFADAPVDVVAGVINRTGQDYAVLPRLMARSSQCWPTDIDWSSVIGDYERITVTASRLDLQGFSQPTPVTGMGLDWQALAAPPPVVRDLGDLKLLPWASRPRWRRCRSNRSASWMGCACRSGASITSTMAWMGGVERRAQFADLAAAGK